MEQVRNNVIISHTIEPDSLDDRLAAIEARIIAAGDKDYECSTAT